MEEKEREESRGKRGREAETDGVGKSTGAEKGKLEKSRAAEGEVGEKKKGELSNTARILTSLAAGGIAGGCAKTVIAPLDR